MEFGVFVRYYANLSLECFLYDKKNQDHQSWINSYVLSNYFYFIYLFFYVINIFRLIVKRSFCRIVVDQIRLHNPDSCHNRIHMHNKYIN